jgi:AbrB family looped-hinge helix DNA binding protein
MNAIVEIDKAGRIVVPKKMRDALHLTPGTRLSIVRQGERITLEPSTNAAQLVIENGVPLIYPANRSNLPILTTEAVNDLLAQTRRERERRYLGLDEDDAPDTAEALARELA